MEKRRVRFNIIDVLIVLAVAGLILGIIFRQDIFEAVDGTDRVVLRLGYKVSEYPEEGFAYFTDGLRLFDADSGEEIGRLSGAAQKVESMRTVEIAGVGLQQLKYEGYVDISGFARAEATKDDKGYCAADGKSITVGTIIDVKTKFHSFKATVISVEEEAN